MAVTKVPTNRSRGTEVDSEQDTSLNTLHVGEGPELHGDDDGKDRHERREVGEVELLGDVGRPCHEPDHE